MEKIIEHFKKTDPKIYEIIISFGISELTKSNTYFQNLCRSICSQQLSTKSASAIFRRLLELFGGKLTPEKMLAMSGKNLRKAGLSKTKTNYMKDLAKKVMDGGIKFEKFLDMGDDEIIFELIKVSGIGVWTVEMFLISSLGREDVFSYGDLGLRKAFQKLYGLKEIPTKKEMEGIVEKWRPYRSYAAKILWKSLEN